MKELEVGDLVRLKYHIKFYNNSEYYSYAYTVTDTPYDIPKDISCVICEIINSSILLVLCENLVFRIDKQNLCELP